MGLAPCLAVCTILLAARFGAAEAAHFTSSNATAESPSSGSGPIISKLAPADALT